MSAFPIALTLSSDDWQKRSTEEIQVQVHLRQTKLDIDIDTVLTKNSILTENFRNKTKYNESLVGYPLSNHLQQFQVSVPRAVYANNMVSPGSDPFKFPAAD